MQYDFLNHFTKRMKSVGLYAILIRNIISKTSWNDFGFETDEERINIVFSVLLFIMERSLIEDDCTIDDISSFVDDINNSYYKKPLKYEDCIQLTDFIVNVILSNEGRQMTFEGYDYKESEYKTIHIRYVGNKPFYNEFNVRRTSYMLTDDGYALLLSTFEVEKNLQIPIQEMIFKMHLEKQSYDKAVDNIKTIFQTIRMQYQKIQNDMYRIRKNALEYSVDEYRTTLEENLATIEETKGKFQKYKDLIKQRIEEYEENEIRLAELSEEDTEKLKNLRTIGEYLGMVIEEHQKILSRHMDLKELYTKELESLSQVALIKRFSLRTDVFDKILEYPEALGNLETLFAPLLRRDLDKIYNASYSFKPHKIVRRKNEDKITEDIDFDEEEWKAEQERIRNEKKKLYEESLSFIIEKLVNDDFVDLMEIKAITDQSEKAKKRLIPNIEIFKEIMVELIRARHIDIRALQEERKNVIHSSAEIFELNYMILEILEKMDIDHKIKEIFIDKAGDEMIVFENVKDSAGNQLNIRCSNIEFTLRA
ncbi:MAG: hypothetical protein K5894_12350 [Lachnospiraceae bacterium]|nr:hypothetical protein [Lachnospiraceae bacterium]